LAYWLEMKFRSFNDLTAPRAKSVIAEYERVLRINPGNIAALAALGYIYWLVGKLEDARKRFEEGMELTAVVRGTYIGELSYGLARVAAEQGQFNTSFDLYQQAIAAEPTVAASRTTGSKNPSAAYYEYMVPAMLRRYARFRAKVMALTHARKLAKDDGMVSEPVARGIGSFVLNDYGNACLFYFFRLAADSALKHAVDSYKRALAKNPDNAIARLNLYFARTWMPGEENPIVELKKVLEAMPTWQGAAFALLQESAREFSQYARRIAQEIRGAQERQDALEAEKKKRQEEKSKLESKATAAPEKQLKKHSDAAAKNLPDATRLAPEPNKTAQSAEPSRLDTVVFTGRRKRDLSGAEEIQKIDDELAKLNNELLTVKEVINKHSAEIKARQDEWSRAAHEIVGKVLQKTKLSPLMKDNEDGWRGKAIHALLGNRSIQWERLDAYDVQALWAWAEALLGNRTVPEDLSAAERLCDHLLTTYHPESFDISLTFREALESLLSTMQSDDAKQALRARIEECNATVRFCVDYWLRSDPVHFNVLQWHQSIVSPAQHRSVAMRALAVAGPSELSSYRRSLAAKYGESGERRLNDGSEEAIEYYRLALELDGANPAYYVKLADAWLALENRGRQLEALDRAADCLEKALELDPGNQEYGRRAGAIRRRRHILDRLGSHALDRWPIVTPIRVEIARNLIPYVEGADGALETGFNQQIAAMRERILEECGVRIPGVRFSTNEELLTGGYRVLVNETPLALGSLSEDKRFSPEPKAKLDAVGAAGDPAMDPVTGDEGWWIGETAWNKVESAGLALWPFMEYMVRHLEALIRANLAEFLGCQEVRNTVEEKFPEVAQALRQDPEGLAALTRLLRSLVLEAVPIVALKEIVRLWQTHRSLPLPELLRMARLLPKVRRGLPGNRSDYRLYRTSKDFEAELNRWLTGSGDSRILAMELAACRDALAAVRKGLDGARRSALVVDDASLRPFIRDLTKTEWPAPAVLSAEELASDLRDRVIGTVKLDKEQKPAAEAR